MTAATILQPVPENQVVEQIVDAIASVTDGAAPLHSPEIRGNEWQYVKECLDTEWVSTAGAYVERFERDLSKLTKAKHVIATVNGTAALHICLVALGVEPGDEVIAPAITFAGTANSIAHAGAHPHFVDIEWRTLGLDPAALVTRLESCVERRGAACINKETGRRIRAIVPVHTFGHACDIEAIVAIAAKWDLPVVEDAAESLGTGYRGRHTGTFGQAGILSFNGNKIATTGGGGAVMTDSDELGRRVRHLSTTAKIPHRWEFIHDAVGYNYRMPNLNAALGCAQLERLDDFLARKRSVADAYRKNLALCPGVTFFEAPEGSQSNYWLNAMVLAPAMANLRDPLLAALHDRKIEARPTWRPLSELPSFTTAPRGQLSCTAEVYRRVINLPSSPRLAD